VDLNFNPWLADEHSRRKLRFVRSRFPYVATLVLAFAGCSRAEKAAPRADAATSPGTQDTQPGAGKPRHIPLAGERVEIPTGSFEAGSVPGTDGRKPQIEQLIGAVELGAFQIDRLPFPNDPNIPPLTRVTRAEAVAKCAERGARLCTELEWERACKGPNSDEYSTGARFEATCSKQPNDCASGFDVLAMGVALREYTASDVLAAGTGASRGAAVKGADAHTQKSAHRCAAREIVPEGERAIDLGFRCCHGPPNAARAEEPHQLPVFERAKLDSAGAARLIESDAATRAWAKDFTYFREPDAADTVVSRGPGDRQGLRFTVAPLLWSPVPGTRYLLLTGRSGKDISVVLAYHVIRDDQYRLAASFVMKNEPGPVAFAYHESIRPRLFFSNCWRCPGETGKVLHREPDSVAIVQP
jgi:hypothetical protein